GTGASPACGTRRATSAGPAPSCRSSWQSRRRRLGSWNSPWKRTTPWVRCWPRFIVTAPDEGELNDRVVDLVEMYADFDLALVRPGGDQLALFMETIPGGRRRVAAYGHELPMVTFAGSMWGASSELGD